MGLHPMQTATPGPAQQAPTPDDERLARARSRVAALKGFYVHLLVFAIVLAALFLINLATGGPWWVLWVLLGWGIGVIAHAATVFGQTSRAIAEWEERKLKQFLDER
jgi:fatty acid desaturase